MNLKFKQRGITVHKCAKKMQKEWQRVDPDQTAPWVCTVRSDLSVPNSHLFKIVLNKIQIFCTSSSQPGQWTDKEGI